MKTIKKLFLVTIFYLFILTPSIAQNCSKCYGKGYVTTGSEMGGCSACSETGRCSVCGGDGQLVCLTHDTNKDGYCTDCSNRGFVQCYECYGNGKCTKCNGYGRKSFPINATCSACNGSGKKSKVKKTPTKKNKTASIKKSGTVTMEGNSYFFNDSKNYKWIRIGNQIWMAENLSIKVEGSYCYDNNSYYCSKYGRLYTWDAAKRVADEIEGWHLPSDAEWKKMERYLGMSKEDVDKVGQKTRRGDIGSKLKSKSGWDNGGSGNNYSGFTALPGGRRIINDSEEIRNAGFFWTSTAITFDKALHRWIDYYFNDIVRYKIDKRARLSVRLVKD